MLVSKTGFSEGIAFEYGYGYAMSQINEKANLPNPIKKLLVLFHKAMSDEYFQHKRNNEFVFFTENKVLISLFAKFIYLQINMHTFVCTHF